MSKYVLILDKEEPIEELLKQNFPEHHQINEHAWGMRTHAFSTEISEKIFPRGDSKKDTPWHVVFRVDAWWGLHNRTFWEWLDQKEG